MEKFSYLTAVNADYIDEIFNQYLQDPDSVDTTWRYLFEGVELGQQEGASSTQKTATVQQQVAPASVDTTYLKNFIRELFLTRGHRAAQLDPLEFQNRRPVEIDSSTQQTLKATSLGSLMDHYKDIYCRTVGFELNHIDRPENLQWLLQKVENEFWSQPVDPEKKKKILHRLSVSEGFEQFLHTRYIAQKRFSIEGGESLIPMLDEFLEGSAQAQLQDFVVGMAHRGRLNVLAHILGKPYVDILSEFEGYYAEGSQESGFQSEGDVKYHMGYSSQEGPLHLSLMSNPSHLEAVNTVILGACRSKMDRGRKALPVLIHGDAAFAGQGLVYETLQMARLEAYQTEGTLHVIVNNQVGFTTDPNQSRSTGYSSDLAKAFGIPVFHVNGNDPEACVRVARLAFEYRQKFKEDVVIDMVCYRKYGHNEGDEPSYTQPVMYSKIKGHRSPRDQYAQSLISQGLVPADVLAQEQQKLYAELTEAQTEAKNRKQAPKISVYGESWKGLRSSKISDFQESFRDKKPLSVDTLRSLGFQTVKVPDDFKMNSKLKGLFELRQKAFESGEGLDWGTSECLAYASLLSQGIPIRMTGQDVERGTFSHRHAVVRDSETAQRWIPLNHLKSDQKEKIYIQNSFLSEQGVLGFEYGYASAYPQPLVIWEAQFGDFANGAQIIIDQFISAAEMKWQRSSGLVLLLPHGYEGQGPEHSSGRIERFLQLCAKNNMQVCNLSTPAQIYHAFRRQVLRDFRTPLVVFTPKSLLRHEKAVSTLVEMSQGGFQEVLTDHSTSAQGASRVLLCSGKIYYELLDQREKLGRKDVAIVRIEQLYPWPQVQLASVLSNFKNMKELVWVQEEPRNMGAWRPLYESLVKSTPKGIPLSYVGRDEAAGPAVGSPKRHKAEQEKILQDGFGNLSSSG